MSWLVAHETWVGQVEALAQQCAAASDVATLARLAPQTLAVAGAMLDADAGGGPVARTLSALNDALTLRVIDLVAQRHRLPAVSWCWLALGSEGRGEQTFVTDQDNGIVFSATGAAEARAMRPLFMACAGEVNQALATCGFPLCTGGVMAGNADCCLSLAEWRERFAGWVRTPEPQALLNATIYFDLRALHGDASLVSTLREYLAQVASRVDVFFHLLAVNALTSEPPLGLFRDFSAPGGVVDLKKSGARLFVDAARIFGLSATQCGTVPRLRHAVTTNRMLAGEAEAAIGAFYQLQRIRLQAQQRALAEGQPPGNLVAPQQLNAFDRRILHEVFKQARLLQQRLKTTFHLEG